MLLRDNKQQIGTNRPQEIAVRRRPTPLGVGHVGAAVLGAAEAARTHSLSNRSHSSLAAAVTFLLV